MNIIPRKFYLDDIFDDFMPTMKDNNMKCDVYEKKGKYHIELEEVVEASYTDKISQLAQSDALPALIQTPDKEWIQTAMIPGNLY